MSYSEQQKKYEIIALILAAGRGKRVSSHKPKQYCSLPNGNILLRQTLEKFEQHPEISAIQVVIHPDDIESYHQITKKFNKCLPPTYGGKKRQDSVLHGLKTIKSLSPQKVLIHDAARPYISTELISHIIYALNHEDAVIPVIPVTDTIKKIKNQQVDSTLPRETLYHAQTPQGFKFAEIIRAYQKNTHVMTDDASIAEAAGMKVITIQGDIQNIKLTTQNDFFRYKESMLTCTGFGFDAHRFTTGDHLILGGIKIPHSQSLDGHSDADVGLHALTDAIFGGLAQGDMGEHFPPSDKHHKNRDSQDFLSFAKEKVIEQGGYIAHIDLTFICQVPKILPYRDAMRQRISEILSIPLNHVSIKATTTEGMGFTGRQEGIAAQAIATLQLPIDIL